MIYSLNVFVGCFEWKPTHAYWYKTNLNAILVSGIFYQKPLSVHLYPGVLGQSEATFTAVSHSH